MLDPEELGELQSLRLQLRQGRLHSGSVATDTAIKVLDLVLTELAGINRRLKNLEAGLFMSPDKENNHA